MNFWKHEIEQVIENFPPEKATLKEDLEDFELEAITKRGGLRQESRLYLGNFL